MKAFLVDPLSKQLAPMFNCGCAEEDFKLSLWFIVKLDAKFRRAHVFLGLIENLKLKIEGKLSKQGRRVWTFEDKFCANHLKRVVRKSLRIDRACSWVYDWLVSEVVWCRLIDWRKEGRCAWLYFHCFVFYNRKLILRLYCSLRFKIAPTDLALETSKWESLQIFCGSKCKTNKFAAFIVWRWLLWWIRLIIQNLSGPSILENCHLVLAYYSGEKPPRKTSKLALGDVVNDIRCRVILENL